MIRLTMRKCRFILAAALLLLPFLCLGLSTPTRIAKQYYTNDRTNTMPPQALLRISSMIRTGHLYLSESNEESELNGDSEEDELIDSNTSSKNHLDSSASEQKTPSDPLNLQSTSPPEQQSQPTLKQKKVIMDRRPPWEGQALNGAAKPRPLPTVWSCLGPLTHLTRPHNFPGTLVFHMLGIYLALDHVGQTQHFIPLFLGDVVMWCVWSCIVLVSSTSMVINDYYDVQLGRDTDPRKSPLVSGALPLYLVRSYLSYLYASALILSAFVPGAPARLSVVIGLVLTYFYTKYLKPQTVCTTHNLVLHAMENSLLMIYMPIKLVLFIFYNFSVD